jgi:hypothetical protein
MDNDKKEENDPKPESKNEFVFRSCSGENDDQPYMLVLSIEFDGVHSFSRTQSISA